MLEWSEYVSRLLEQKSSFDGISMSLGDSENPVGVPPIIKASVMMLDRMLECQGKFNILVFPERIQSIFIFTLVKLLYNISEGRIERSYDPETFVPGEKMRFGKAVVEFMRIEEEKGKKYMRIRLADLEDRAPIEFFPLFQKTTAQKLSKYKKFAEEKAIAKKKFPQMSANERYLKLLSDYKTHMDSSIVNMTSVMHTKELISGCSLCGKSIKDAILVGQANYEGKVTNIGAGQLGGIPAIVLASDLYAIAAMAEQGHPIQSIIIDGSNVNTLLSQMDALDELMRLGVPITCVTDTVNSFDLQPFLDRQFNMWRWDENSITDKLYDTSNLNADRKAKHCAKREVSHLVSEGNEISTAFRLLSLHKSEQTNMSAQMLKLFDKLYSLSFIALRETVPLSEEELVPVRKGLEESASLLAGEKNFIAQQTFDDYSTVIACLKKIFTRGYIWPKHDALAEKLLRTNYKNICIVVSERAEKNRVQAYWQMWCRRKRLNTQVFVLHPAEYYPAQCTQFSATIVTSWLQRAVMRRILYSFNTQAYTVLLYDYEKRWQKYTTARWNAILDRSQNKKTIEKSFNTDKLHVSTSRFVPAMPADPDTPKEDELAGIENTLRENKYRRYVASGGQKSVADTAEAIPVNYIGGYLAFYRLGHKVISASDIILNDGNKIAEVLPENLKLGDFVVVRETNRDLIREMADLILEREGKSNLRSMATKWKEAMEIEKLFYTPDEIYQWLQNVGCTRGYATVLGWLQDEDFIAPQSKQDLEYITKVTGSGVLTELLDQIYDAAGEVRAAHVQAGRTLSMRLRSRIVEALKEYGDIDTFNIWEPIEMQIDGIGLVRILKIIDIGTPVIVDINDTNRLIDEE